MYNIFYATIFCLITFVVVLFFQNADGTSIPQMSSPPPWLQERLPGDRHSMVSFTGSIMSTPELEMDYSTEQKEFRCRTKIETEFPATPSSPKSKHVNVMERKKEGKKSSSTSSLLSSKSGPNRQRTMSTSSLSRARGLSLSSAQSVTKSNSHSMQSVTNQQSCNNQGNLTSQKSSMNTSNQNCAKSVHVPSDQSGSSTAGQTCSQGLLSQSLSRIPSLPAGKSQDEIQLRRNSLKAEYSIRIGSLSPAARSTPPPGNKPQIARPLSQSSRSSAGSQGDGCLRSQQSLTSAGKSQASGSKIPMVTKSVKSVSKENVKSAAESSKLQITVSSKIVPPKSPAVRHTGIRTTLKTDNSGKNSSKSDTSKSKNNSLVTGVKSVHTNLKMVYSINSTVASAKVSDRKDNSSRPALPERGIKPVSHRPESHFPIMGLTTLSHGTTVNSVQVSNVYANVANIPTSFSSSSMPCQSRYSNSSLNSDQSETTNSRRGAGQYFYDYSDEDSDCHLTCQVSKDFSVCSASTISLDEMLDRTIENINTPVDSEFSSMSLTHSITSDNVNMANRDMFVANILSTTTQTIDENTLKKASEKFHDNANNNLTDKPDIVKDTEECEQRKLKKSIPISEIPGSSMPGYRAKRPKSLILGAKEKKFMYCEYGSTSGSDGSEEDWNCKVSYAKTAKEHEIKSKVAKSLKTGDAKVISALPKLSTNSQKDSKGKSGKEKMNVKSTQLPKPSAIKKPSKIPPPVAAKPIQKRSSVTKATREIPRPKSVEICVNTALSIHSNPCYPYLDKSLDKDLSKAGSDMSLNTKSNGNCTDLTSTTFEEVKVERSGSKDDGYSTMSSDIQPEHLEKYSDAFESSTNSNEARNSNLSLNSQNSYSSEDRQSGQGSLGRVRAMKMKFELENHKSDSETSPTKSPPVSPKKSQLKPPKSVSEKLVTSQCDKGNQSETLLGSKIPKAKTSQLPVKETATKSKSAIPQPKSALASSKKDVTVSQACYADITIPTKQELSPVICTDQNIQRKCFPITNPNLIQSSTPIRPIVTVSNLVAQKLSPILAIPPPHIIQQPVMTKDFSEHFDQLTTFEKIEFLKESYDSNSSISGSDLTSLHISEDNILSDIPEEKDGYESSVRSAATSFSSIPDITNAKKYSQQVPHHSHHGHQTHHTHNAPVRHQFSSTLRRYWSSCDGIVRALLESDFHKQQTAKFSPDYDELYDGCLNIETLLERSSSESDIYTRGDKPDVTLLPRLGRSRSTSEGCLQIDEIAVEERVQLIRRINIEQQVSEVLNDVILFLCYLRYNNNSVFVYVWV